jgi:undecaprenyl phosphate-alpha-L-ara4FN deformylase
MREIASLRVDIDSLGDVAALPVLLDRLEEGGIRGSFFIATGRDRSGRNLGRYLSDPKALWEKKALQRYGLWNLLLGLIAPKEVETEGAWREIPERGHEVGLHGYEHHRWIRRLERAGEAEIRVWIQAGLRAFYRAFGRRSTSFASPGFRTSLPYLRALDSFGFGYASDFLGGIPFYPPLCETGPRSGTLQVPVSLPSLEDCAERGIGEKGVLEWVDRALGERGPFTFYLHPNELLRWGSLFEKILDRIDRRFVPLEETARRWNDENSPHLRAGSL